MVHRKMVTIIICNLRVLRFDKIIVQIVTKVTLKKDLLIDEWRKSRMRPIL